MTLIEHRLKSWRQELERGRFDRRMVEQIISQLEALAREWDAPPATTASGRGEHDEG